MDSPAQFFAKQGIATEESMEEAKIMLGECYEDIKKLIPLYIDIPEEKVELIAIWIISTYFQQEFESFPFLFLNAMRGSGKTRTLKFISSLGKQGDGSVVNNLTDAVLFRHPKGVIMCIDEVEQIGSKEKATLRELLNAAYKKGMKVKRIKKARVQGVESLITETFEPYFPIVMANIWGIDEVLGDRAITLVLEKSNKPWITKKIEDFQVNPKFSDLKVRLTRLADVSAMTLRKKTYITGWNGYIDSKYNDITTLTTITTITSEQQENLDRDEFFNKIDEAGIDGRNFELFFPLLVVSKMLNNDIFEKLLKIIKEMVSVRREDEYAESKDVSLYQFVAEHGKEGNLIAVKDLTAHFRLFVGDTGNEELWVNEKWMGRALKRLQLVKFKKKFENGRAVILDTIKAKEKIKMFQTIE